MPGGTINKNEWPVLAAIREVYEETGAELASLDPIGQYVIKHPDKQDQVKTIYVAQIKKMHDLPAGFETDAVRLLSPIPHSEEIIKDDSYSLLLKDNVYYLACQLPLKK